MRKIATYKGFQIRTCSPREIAQGIGEAETLYIFRPGDDDFTPNNADWEIDCIGERGLQIAHNWIDSDTGMDTDEHDTENDEIEEIETMQAVISLGNSKLGKIPNFSLTPGVSCARCAASTCHANGCYALKAYRMYPPVKAAWDNNTEMALFDLETLENEIITFLSKKRKIEYFRIHAAGDFITSDYLAMWVYIAAQFPNVQFLAFTKQFDMIHAMQSQIPANLQIVLSHWEGITIPAELAQRFPVAYVAQHADDIPGDCFTCPGSCKDCKTCWTMHHDVYFVKH